MRAFWLGDLWQVSLEKKLEEAGAFEINQTNPTYEVNRTFENLNISKAV